MRRAEGGMQRKGRRREVRGNVGGDGRGERWRASEEERGAEGSRGEGAGEETKEDRTGV